MRQDITVPGIGVVFSLSAEPDNDGSIYVALYDCLNGEVVYENNVMPVDPEYAMYRLVWGPLDDGSYVTRLVHSKYVDEHRGFFGDVPVTVFSEPIDDGEALDQHIYLHEGKDE